MKNKKRTLAFGIILGSITLSIGAAENNTAHLSPIGTSSVDSKKRVTYLPDQIIIKIESTQQPSAPSNFSSNHTDILESLKYRYGLNNEEVFFSHHMQSTPSLRGSQLVGNKHFNNVFVLDITSGNALDIAKKITHEPSVVYAEPIYTYETQANVNDPFFSSSGTWGQIYDDLWGVHAISAPDVWDSTLGENVLVAVIDTGIDANHPDLSNNVWQNNAEIPNNNIDDDNNGFIDDVKGWNFVDNSATPTDIHGHGTHVSGTIAAEINNNEGIVGIAPNAKILPIKGLSNNGTGSSVDLAAALIYAADMNADVINNSWGGGGPSQLIHDAVKYAYNKGSVVVAAAGNASSPVSRFHPAGYPEVISVAATDVENKRAFFSNWGVRIDVAAPGVDILSPLSSEVNTSTIPAEDIINERYLRAQGTSMSSPHVAGQIALMLSLNPNLSAEQARYILHNSSKDLGVTGFDTAFGRGRIDAPAALHMVDTLGDTVPNLFADIITPFPGLSLGHIDITGSATGPDFDHYTLEWGENSTNSPIQYVEFASSNTQVNNAQLGTLDISAINNEQQIMLRLNVFDTHGKKTSYYSLFIADNDVKAGWPKEAIATFNRGGIDTAQTFADLDRDGQLEIITTLGNLVTVYNKEGVRFPGFPVEVSSLIASAPSIADIDNDGQDEMVFTLLGHQNKALSILALNLDGSPVAGFPFDYQGFPGDPDFEIVSLQSPIIVDADNDGELEFILSVREWQVTGNATHPPRHQLAVLTLDGEFEPNWPVQLSEQFSFAGGAFAAVDYEKDGDFEIVVIYGANNRSHLSAYEHDGQKRFGLEIGRLHGFSKLAIEDITKNGRYEIMTAGLDGDTSVFHVINDQGNPVAGWPQTLPIRRVDFNPFTVLTDSDDNKTLMIAGEDAFLFYTTNGQPIGTPVPILDSQGGRARIMNEMIRVEQTGDEHGTQAIYVNLLDGVQIYSTAGATITGKYIGLESKTPAIGDLDNDGILDFASVNNQNYTYVWNSLPLASSGELTGWFTHGGNLARTYSIETHYEPSDFTSHYPTMNIRTSFNNWDATAMVLIADHTWQATINQVQSPNPSFKFDIHNDWVTNFGDDNADLIADQNGDNISLPTGGAPSDQYTITLNDSTLTYTIEREPTGDWQRTVVYMYAETNETQSLFTLGGINWDQSLALRGIDCSINPLDCAIPIQHNLFKDDPSRVYDKHLDWDVTATTSGSPMVWTTDIWPAELGEIKIIANDDYGQDPENLWGMHYWKLDVMMDCSKTLNGMFELKTYMQGGDGWEGDITQPGAPYPSDNHFAQCGETNVFRRNENDPIVP